MKQKHLYSLLDQSYTTIAVAFRNVLEMPAGSAPPAPNRQKGTPWANPATPPQGQRTYTYKVPKDLEIEPGDFVVVARADGFSIGQVFERHETPKIDIDADFDYKWIVQKIDVAAYDQRVKAESAFAETMLEIERTRQRELMVEGFKQHLPEGSEARQLFDRTIGQLTAPPIPPADGPDKV